MATIARGPPRAPRVLKTGYPNEKRILTELCYMGNATDNPCTNRATISADFGTPLCEEYEAIMTSKGCR